MRPGRHGTTGLVLAAILLLLGPVCMSRGADLADLLPDPDSFRAYDRPSDRGDTITVEWAATVKTAGKKEDTVEAVPAEDAPAGFRYVLEVARAPEDFDADNFKTVEVKPVPGSLKSANMKYYGFYKENECFYVAEIKPAELFIPPEPTMQEAMARFLTDGERQRAEEDMSKTLKGWLEKKKKEMHKEIERDLNTSPLYFRLAVASDDDTVYVKRDGAPLVLAGAGARVNYFKWFKLNNLFFAVLISAAVMAFIQIARRNPNLYIRRIPGLEAVEEAIGRATEMGRGVFYIPGIEILEHRATIASMNILSRVARRAADYDTRVQVLNMDPVVTAVTQEVVQQAYTEAGRPDAYDPDDVTLSAFDQFSYVAAVAGRMVREQPAAVFMLGHFYAESLLLSETGASTGAIQVAGTDAFTQLPFFITTCDYTLIGEELYAASAYLSREPKLLGSLRGQDIGKALLMLTMLIGAIVMTVGTVLGWHLGWIKWMVTSFS